MTKRTEKGPEPAQAIQDCIDFAENGSLRGKPANWHSDMLHAARRALRELVEGSAADLPAQIKAGDEAFPYLLVADLPAPEPLTDGAIKTAMKALPKYMRDTDGGRDALMAYARHIERAALATQPAPQTPESAGESALLREDAERYRVLRSGRFMFLPRLTDPFDDRQMFLPEGLDAACDRARALGKPA